MKPRTQRQDWMAVLARASRSEIAALVGTPEPAHELMKAPETGTVMVEGRAGGAGRRFNLGEATMTRCVVRLADGSLGFSYALGRDGAKARLAAILDAQLQAEAKNHERQDGERQNGGSQGGALQAGIASLAAAQAAARDVASRKAAATKVDFFTLVRGA